MCCGRWATRRFVAESLLAEASLLAFCGATVGAFLAVLAIYLFRRLIMMSLGVPFPCRRRVRWRCRWDRAVAGHVQRLLAALLPAIKISRQDPAISIGSSVDDRIGRRHEALRAGKGNTVTAVRGSRWNSTPASSRK